MREVTRVSLMEEAKKLQALLQGIHSQCIVITRYMIIVVPNKAQE